jgi:hypothetical protein
MGFVRETRGEAGAFLATDRVGLALLATTADFFSAVGRPLLREAISAFFM